jgi:hypothetical protein
MEEDFPQSSFCSGGTVFDFALREIKQGEQNLADF